MCCTCILPVARQISTTAPQQRECCPTMDNARALSHTLYSPPPSPRLVGCVSINSPPPVPAPPGQFQRSSLHTAVLVPSPLPASLLERLMVHPQKPVHCYYKFRLRPSTTERTRYSHRRCKSILVPGSPVGVFVPTQSCGSRSLTVSPSPTTPPRPLPPPPPALSASTHPTILRYHATVCCFGITTMPKSAESYAAFSFSNNTKHNVLSFL